MSVELCKKNTSPHFEGMLDIDLSIDEHNSTKLYELVQSFVCVEQFPNTPKVSH